MCRFRPFNELQRLDLSTYVAINAKNYLKTRRVCVCDLSYLPTIITHNFARSGVPCGVCGAPVRRLSCPVSRGLENTRFLARCGPTKSGRNYLSLLLSSSRPRHSSRNVSPALGGTGARRRLNPGGALRGRLLVALATSRLAISFEGVIRNFPWVSKYVLVAYVAPCHTAPFCVSVYGTRESSYNEVVGGSAVLLCMWLMRFHR